MIDLKSRLAELCQNKKNLVIAVVGGLILVLLFIGEFFSADEGEIYESAPTEINVNEYSEQKEKQLKNLLQDIEGAGSVEVMITVESCYENVYAKGYSTKTDSDESGNDTETSEEYIIVKNGSNTEECLVIKVYEPQIKGVAVVAEGADDIGVKKAITETVCALFDISSAKVSVTTKYKE